MTHNKNRGPPPLGEGLSLPGEVTTHILSVASP